MQTLEYCTLLQACEYLAFNWLPFCTEDELFLTDRKRLYFSEPNLDDENAKLAYGWQLSRLKRAKKELLILFNSGLTCIIDNKNTKVEKIPITDDMDKLMYIGTPLYKSYCVLGMSSLPIPEPDYKNDNDQGLYIKDKWYYDIKIRFYELEKFFREYIEIKPVEPHTFNLFVSGCKLCCQRDNEPYIELHTLSNGAKNTLVLEYIIDNPDRIITKQELIQNSGSTDFTDADTITNTLQTLFNKLPNIKTAFFPTVSSTEILCRLTVTNRELYENGLPDPI